MRITKIALICLTAALVASMPAEAKTKKKQASQATGTQVIFTGDIAGKVYGYNGKTPVNIHVKGNKIERIEVLPNDETPQYLKRATAKILPQYEGKTLTEAKKVRPDVATGATYTSEALIKNIQMGLEQAGKKNNNKKGATRK